MKNFRFTLYFLPLLFFACNSLEKDTTGQEHTTNDIVIQGEQIANYVVDVYEDSKGNLWFGTLEKGLAKYDGKELKYLTTEDGLLSNRAVSIIEDREGKLWIGTGSGICIYDGKSFEYLTKNDGLCSDMIGGMFFDSDNLLWIGSWEGLCTYDGKEFKSS